MKMSVREAFPVEYQAPNLSPVLDKVISDIFPESGYGKYMITPIVYEASEHKINGIVAPKDALFICVDSEETTINEEQKTRLNCLVSNL